MKLEEIKKEQVVYFSLFNNVAQGIVTDIFYYDDKVACVYVKRAGVPYPYVFTKNKEYLCYETEKECFESIVKRRKEREERKKLTYNELTKKIHEILNGEKSEEEKTKGILQLIEKQGGTY